MGALSYSDRFHNVKKWRDDGTYTGIQIASKLNQKNGQDYKLIDAIDIDWNNAWMNAARTYINTTDDLFTAIDSVIDIDDLNEMRTNIETILMTYVTKSELEEILNHYQKPLKGGANIEIDEENFINAYGLLSLEEADERFTYKDTFNALVEELHSNYYLKPDADAKMIEISNLLIDERIIKNADERFNDLEKISSWILKQFRFVPIPYEEIDLESDTEYYIKEGDKYVLVDREYIESHPEEQYYISKDINEDISELVQRVDDIDIRVGNVYYNEDTDTYTYTGIMYNLHDLYTRSTFLESQFRILSVEFQDVKDTANRSYNLAYDAINLAYNTYDYSYETRLLVLNATSYAEEAYIMAYDAIVKVGKKHSYSYFTELTSYDIEILLEDPEAFDTFIFLDENNMVPIKTVYHEDLDYQYYKFIPEVQATGIYKDIDELADISYAAKYSADNSLFRLNSEVSGTEYVDMALSPNENDGTNRRTIHLDIIEANVDIEDGTIIQDGIITTYSLFNSLSYHGKFIEINGENSEIDGLIHKDTNGNIVII